MKNLMLSLIWVFSALLAKAEDNPETVVKDYLKADQELRWEDVAALQHTVFIEKMRSLSFLQMPRSSAAVQEAEREEIARLLKSFGVTTVEEFWSLPARTFAVRCYRQGAESAKAPEKASLKNITTVRQGNEVQVNTLLEVEQNGKVDRTTRIYTLLSEEGHLRISDIRVKTPPGK